ncbi:MAG: hypothetical protein AAGA66_14270 [Bacteroidota bacterium]
MMASIYDMIKDEDAMIVAFALFSILFCLLSLALLSLIIISKIKRNKNESVKNEFWPKSQKALALITIAPMDSMEYKKSIFFLKKMMEQSRKVVQWVLDEIVKQQANLSGESKTNLLQAYKVLKLKEYSLKKLKSRRWNVVASGIQELERMEQHDCEQRIRKFLHAKNKDLRKTARLALASLAEKPLDFLEHVREEVNEWEQMSIKYRLRGKRKDNLPDFSGYYLHSEPSVVRFSISMSVYFNCFEHIPQLIDLLATGAEDLQVTVIEALSKLEAFQAIEAIETLASETDHQPIVCAALKFLGNVGCSEGHHVIERFIHDEDVEVRMEAVNAAIRLDLDFSDENNDLRRMYAHHQNHLIS